MKRWALHQCGRIHFVQDLPIGCAPLSDGVLDMVEVSLDVTDATHCIVNGAAVAYSPAGAERLRNPPRIPEAVWDIYSETWVDLRDPVDQVAGQWTDIRRRRDVLLRESDWVALRANEQGVPLDPAWVAYRQALRDITKQTDPANIVWPASIE